VAARVPERVPELVDAVIAASPAGWNQSLYRLAPNKLR
jgi:hypothetical protein